MCGIVAMVGPGDMTSEAGSRLAALEYRGYDSWGVAALTQGQFFLTREVGSVSKALEKGRLRELPEAGLAIAHTRWATHGRVSVPNAHPHLSFGKRFAIAHNGVIENHAQLRAFLASNGIEMRSETDSEVVAHLLEWHYDASGSHLEAVRRTLAELTGEYALVILAVDDPRTVYGARYKSPMLAAVGDGGAILTSDQLAVNGLAAEAIYLEDGDIVALTASGIGIYQDEDGRLAPVERDTLAVDAGQTVDKAGFDHFMIKEIHEVPDSIAVVMDRPATDFAGVLPVDPGGRTWVTGSGSAYHVAHLAQYLFADLAATPVHAVIADEAKFSAPVVGGDVVIAVSQSGETFDTLETVRNAKAVGAHVVSVSNVPGSSQERLADVRLQQRSGPEICVLSTKSIVSQVVILVRLALEHGLGTGVLSQERYKACMSSLQDSSKLIRGFIEDSSDRFRELARKYSRVEQWFFIGRGPLYSVALESSLKFKEVSYRHAEGIAGGFFKHGTISLVHPGFHTVALLPSPETSRELYNASLATISEIAARGGPVISLGPDLAGAGDASDVIEQVTLPYAGNVVSDVLLQLVAGQLLAYHFALDLGREIDQPRALAKAVTVR